MIVRIYVTSFIKRPSIEIEVLQLFCTSLCSPCPCPDFGPSKDDSILSRPVHRRTTKTRSASQIVNNRLSCGDVLLASNSASTFPFFHQQQPAAYSTMNGMIMWFFKSAIDVTLLYTKGFCLKTIIHM